MVCVCNCNIKAAVCAFKATLSGGLVIEGISKEKKKAEQEFKDAVDRVFFFFFVFLFLFFNA